jgi:hypothetical protein
MRALANARRSDSTVALSSALAEALVALEAGQGPQGHHRRRDAYGVIVTPEISHGGWKAGETEPFSRGGGQRVSHVVVGGRHRHARTIAR